MARDISSYYILGFASTNQSKDGRFRRISVRLKNRSGVKVEARDGYYADRDFTHTARGDREIQLQEQLTTQIPATDVPLFVTAGWFRLAADRYYVPVSVAVPGSAVPASNEKITLDVAGFIRDERGAPVGRIRDTLTVPPETTDGLAARQVLYQTGVTLPPGRFSIKVVVRENTTGQMGTFETAIVVPELKTAPVKVSSLVLGTQLQNVAGRKTVSPLVRDGVELVPNLTHIVSRRQKLYFYYEVYEPARGERRPAAANQPRVLSRQGEGVRNAGRRADADRCRRSPRGRLPVRGAGRQASSPVSIPARSTSSTKWPDASSSRGSSSTCGENQRDSVELVNWRRIRSNQSPRHQVDQFTNVSSPLSPARTSTPPRSCSSAIRSAAGRQGRRGRDAPRISRSALRCAS